MSSFAFKLTWVSIFLTGAGLFRPALAAGVCEAPQVSQTAPLCPKTTTLLDERYPVSAVSVSDDSGGYDFVERFVDEVLRATQTPPIFLLNVKDETFARLSAHVPATVRAQLKQVVSSGKDEMGEDLPVYLNWQQDFVKGSFDPRTGQTQARFNSNYPGVGDLAQATSKAALQCGMTTGAPLPDPSPNIGYSGGNFESVGGVCVLGDSLLSTKEWSAFAKGICGSEPVVKAPTAALASHHLDEIFKMIPTGSGDCDFVLGVGSARKALQVFEAAPESLAFDKTQPGGSAGNAVLRGLEIACGAWGSASLRAHHVKPGYPDEVEKTEDGRRLLAPHGTGYYSFKETEPYACSLMKNKDLLFALKNDDVFREYNQLMQKQIDAFTARLLATLKRVHPTCAIRTLELPQLFAGQLVVERDGTHALSTTEEDSGYSVYPNPSNGDAIGKTLMMPDPNNSALRSSLSTSISALGLTPVFIDTLFAHGLEGDLHCSTQVFRACRVK